MKVTSMKKAIPVLALAMGIVGIGHAQNWGDECFDPNNTAPISDDFAVTGQFSDFFTVLVGTSGNVTYGGGTMGGAPFCYRDATTMNAIGRFVVGTGPVGSRQTSFDNNMALTMSYPYPIGAYNYFELVRTDADGTVTKTRFGSSDFTLVFDGASDRYFVIETTQDGVAIHLRVDLEGDAVRWDWGMTQTAAQTAGAKYALWVGMSPCIMTPPGRNDPETGASQAWWGFYQNSNRGYKDGYAARPNAAPLQITTRYNRVLDPIGFPKFINLAFGQTSFYGLRLENGATEATVDKDGNSDATDSSDFNWGQSGFLLGAPGDNDMPDVYIPDTTIGSYASLIQKFNAPADLVVVGATTHIVHYFRTTWAFSRYPVVGPTGVPDVPFATVVDVPRLIATNTSNPQVLQPSPDALDRADGAFRAYVQIDNIRGFTGAETMLRMENVAVTLNLPAGLELVDRTEPTTKSIAVIEPKEVGAVSWLVRATGDTVGTLPFTVNVKDGTSGATTSVNGNIVVSAVPRITLKQGANLISFPWSFTDSSLDAVFGLKAPTDYRAYSYENGAYQPALSAERGKSYFVISETTIPSLTFAQASRPADTSTGAPLVSLKGGWNLVGNPYNYAFPLGQIIGVSNSLPGKSFLWNDLVTGGLVSGTIVYYDANANGGLGGYVYVSGDTTPLQPNRGYWFYVPTAQPLTLQFPPIYADFLVNSNRSATKGWVQSDRQWRLQMVARSKDSMDDQTYVGMAATPADVKKLSIYKPPMTPVQNVEVAVIDKTQATPTRMAQALGTGNGRTEWAMNVYSKNDGTTTVTWPNLSTVPKNLRFRIVDVATGTARDMRQSSGYSFQAAANSTREFKVTVEPGTEQRALIGNVVVSKPSGRDVDPNAPFTIAYTLSNSATTSIRILSGSGKEVYSISRGRADGAGENNATWNLRDSANRAVAPGTYRVEILAETVNGERVRRIVPVNVVR